ncbi:hypothetical protein J3R30DRAFT_2088158 [Lentinula aciculospora]|uniref:Uncharacterized protein n=1 Tax=Lentinula aciculospora TaxID=153920 RepID=A0A9W8ZU38_9AGAR|nr:hypothetical protein J3R30DRAFT_2088158 [Lentinula aciculospora]
MALYCRSSKHACRYNPFRRPKWPFFVDTHFLILRDPRLIRLSYFVFALITTFATSIASPCYIPVSQSLLQKWLRQQFPYILSSLAFTTIILSAAMFDNHKNHWKPYSLTYCTRMLIDLFPSLPLHLLVFSTTTNIDDYGRRTPTSDGKMEAFLRVMKDVEHNPQVLHLPAPHIWQFTPTPAVPVSTPLSFNPPSFRQLPMAEHLVVTLEIHVRRDLPDEDVLRPTRWAWEKCVGALTGGVNKHAVNGVKRDIGGGETVKADVTVGVVRG